MKITKTDVESLAGRLYARGTSKLATASAEEKCDLETAARILWLLLDDLAPEHVIELHGGRADMADRVHKLTRLVVRFHRGDREIEREEAGWRLQLARDPRFGRVDVDVPCGRSAGLKTGRCQGGGRSDERESDDGGATHKVLPCL